LEDGVKICTFLDVLDKTEEDRAIAAADQYNTTFCFTLSSRCHGEGTTRTLKHNRLQLSCDTAPRKRAHNCFNNSPLPFFVSFDETISSYDQYV
jgi:hypothetical protein